jgi:hypothetical protein
VKQKRKLAKETAPKEIILAHDVWPFQFVSTEGFTPFCCANIALELFRNDRIE